MKIFDRVKNILVSPKTEWLVIETENTPHVKILTSYVLLLALIPALTSFISNGLFGHGLLIRFGLTNAIVQYLSAVLGVYIVAFVIDILAGAFDAKKDFNRAVALVAYAYTPVFVAGIINIIPGFGWLKSLVSFAAAVYAFYQIYIGLQPMMKAPAEKKTAYFIVSIVVMLVAVMLLSVLLGAILIGGAVGAAAYAL